MRKNNLNVFKNKISEGKFCVGMVMTLSDPTLSEIAAEAGYDFTWVDMEHGSMGLETALGHVRAVQGTETAAFVRVVGNNPLMIKPVLELAPAGVIIPMVNSAEEAEAAVSACRYPPRGIRGFGPTRGRKFGSTPVSDYLKGAENDPMVIIQIEHISAVRDIDRILAVKGLDCICVGPSDLSSSMGRLGDIGHPDVVAAIDEVAAKTRAAGVMLGTATKFTPAWVERGTQWLAADVDCDGFFIRCQKVIEDAKSMADSKKAPSRLLA